MGSYEIRLYDVDEDGGRLEISRFEINHETLIKILKILRPNDWETLLQIEEEIIDELEEG